MFQTKRYVTAGINTTLPLQVQHILWGLIENLRGKLQLDYLQVFEFQKVDIENETAILIHSQEFPTYEKKYQIKVPKAVLKQLGNKKIFVIDDRDYCTMLFSYEY